MHASEACLRGEPNLTERGLTKGASLAGEALAEDTVGISSGRCLGGEESGGNCREPLGKRLLALSILKRKGSSLGLSGEGNLGISSECCLGGESGGESGGSCREPLSKVLLALSIRLGGSKLALTQSPPTHEPACSSSASFSRNSSSFFVSSSSFIASRLSRDALFFNSTRRLSASIRCLSCSLSFISLTL